MLITSSALARSTGCKEGNCENGYGKWVYTDKTTYEGEWVGTKKHGQGTETWPNGYIYKGEFKNSLWSGLGTLKFPDGSTYEGEWANGFMNGRELLPGLMENKKQEFGKWKVTRIMPNENYFDKIKELPEAIKQLGGLGANNNDHIFIFFILNNIFGEGDELVAKMKIEEERIAEERKLTN